MKSTTVILNGSTSLWKMEVIKLAERLNIDISHTNDTGKNKLNGQNNRGIHLAIFSEPFLSLLLSGKKTIESRFSLNKNGPFEKVCSGDIVFVKKTGGPILGYFYVSKVLFFNKPNSQVFKSIKEKYHVGICSNADQTFWEQRKNVNYVSLMYVSNLNKIQPFIINKKDRTAWVVIKNKVNEVTVFN